MIGLPLKIDDHAFKHDGAPVQSPHRPHMGHLLLLGTDDPAKLVHLDNRRLESRDESDDETLDRWKHQYGLDERRDATDRVPNLREIVDPSDQPDLWFET